MSITRSPIHLEDDAAAGFHIQDDFERFYQLDFIQLGSETNGIDQTSQNRVGE